MGGKWLPYPDHPRVRELTRLWTGLQERIEGAIQEGDIDTAARLLPERQAVEALREEVAAGLVRDETLIPRWVTPTEAEEAAGTIPCLECGNRIPAGQWICSYCGWTYRVETPGEA